MWLFLAAFALWPQPAPTQSIEITDKQIRSILLYGPKPEYPYEARVKGQTGRGTAIVNIDLATGRVTKAEIAESTGSTILDEAALATFQQWRFKPGTVTKVKIPIIFSLASSGSVRQPTGGELRALAVYAPRPPYPYEARAGHLQGSGVVIVTIDPATGNVTTAVMAVSTGIKILDEAAASTFSQWRFRPGTVKKVKIPIHFTLSGVRYSAAEVRVEKALPMEQLLAPLLGKGNVINAPIPVYPEHPLRMRKAGRGVYEIHVDKAGIVTGVKILKSSGDQAFDDVTVNTLRQWRLRHGPKVIELPLVFVLTPDNYGVWIP